MHNVNKHIFTRGLPWWLSGQESACQRGDAGSIPGWGRCPGGGSGDPLPCSRLRKPMDREAWRPTERRTQPSDGAAAASRSPLTVQLRLQGILTVAPRLPPAPSRIVHLSELKLSPLSTNSPRPPRVHLPTLWVSVPGPSYKWSHRVPSASKAHWNGTSPFLATENKISEY